MLVSALDSHPEVTCHGELFIGKDVTSSPKTFKQLDSRFRSKGYRYKNPDELVRQLMANNEKNQFGFKLMLNQHPGVIAQMVEDKSWSIILLRRHNPLACYSSHLIAKTTGQGSVRRVDRIRTAQVLFDEQEFLAFRRRRQRMYDRAEKKLKLRHREFLPVDYVSLVTGDAYAKVLSFLNVESQPELNAKTQKRNPTNIVDRFTNQNEVRLFLRKHGLEHWLVEHTEEPAET